MPGWENTGIIWTLLLPSVAQNDYCQHRPTSEKMCWAVWAACQKLISWLQSWAMMWWKNKSFLETAIINVEVARTMNIPRYFTQVNRYAAGRVKLPRFFSARRTGAGWYTLLRTILSTSLNMPQYRTGIFIQTTQTKILTFIHRKYTYLSLLIYV